MLGEDAAVAAVYQALDQVLADGNVATESRRAIHVAVDIMRSAPATAAELRCAESISVEMHKLSWALCQSEEAYIASAREALHKLAANWLNRRICH